MYVHVNIVCFVIAEYYNYELLLNVRTPGWLPRYLAYKIY